MSTSIFQEIFLSTARKIPVEKEIFWRFHVVVKRRNLIGSLTLGIEKPKLFIALNVLAGFFPSFRRNHGYFPWQIYLGKVQSHTLRQFPAVKGSRVTAHIIHLQYNITVFQIVQMPRLIRIKCGQNWRGL